MSWQLFTLISVLSLSLAVILQRILLSRHKAEPYAYAAIFQGLVGILLLAAACIHGFSLAGLGQYLFPVVISTLCFGVGNVLYAKTLQTVEASSFSVLFATQAIWTMLLGALLLGEHVSMLQIIGTGLILASSVLLAKNLRRIVHERGMILGLATGLLFGVAIYFWSYVGRYVDGLSWAAVSFIATGVVIVLLRPRLVTQLQPFFTGSMLSRMTVLGVVYGLGSITMLFAYQLGSFAAVSPLRQTSIIVTVLLALLLLPSERNHIARKLLAGAICTIGVLLIIL